MHELSAHRPKLMEKILQRYKSDKRDFLNRREEWQARLNKALSRMTDLRNIHDEQLLQANSQEVRLNETNEIRVLGTSQNRAKPKPAYRSEIKRAIRMVLTISPDATDLGVCRLFDKDGVVDLPANWQTRKSRSFEDAYRDPAQRPKIEKQISKVRTDLRSLRWWTR